VGKEPSRKPGAVLGKCALGKDHNTRPAQEQAGGNADKGINQSRQGLLSMEQLNTLQGKGREGGEAAAEAGSQEQPSSLLHPGLALSQPEQDANQEASRHVHQEGAQRKYPAKQAGHRQMYAVARHAARRSTQSYI
jgi:hypothetical protein